MKAENYRAVMLRYKSQFYLTDEQPPLTDHDREDAQVATAAEIFRQEHFERVLAAKNERQKIIGAN